MEIRQPNPIAVIWLTNLEEAMQSRERCFPIPRGCTKRPGERAEEAKSEAWKYGRIEASEYKRSGKGGSYDLTERVCQ
jgi:hypothetical protein